MIKIVLVFLCIFILSPSYAANLAVGTASAEVISINHPQSVKSFEFSSQNVQLMSFHKKDGCVQYYFVSNSSVNSTDQKFGTCSNIVRTRVVGDSIMVSMPDNSKLGYSTYIYNNGTVREISKK